MLQACLSSLAALHALTDTAVRILVVHNGDAAGLPKTREIVDRLAPDALLLHEPEIGISNARNKALRAGVELQAEALVFVDDDQTVEPNWLRDMVRIWRRTGATAVKSWVVWDFGGPQPKARYFDDPRPRPKDGWMATSCATNGVLIDKIAFVDWGLRFDPIYNFSGSGDIAFFHAVRNCGGQIWKSGEVEITEHCPPERQSLRYLTKRAFSKGATIRPRSKGRLNALLLFLKFSLKSLLHLLIYPVTYATPRWHHDLLAAARNAGKAYAALGFWPVQYAVVEGG